MKKNILLVFFVFLSGISVSYSYLKANEASMARQIADDMRLEAERLRDEAVLLQEAAMQSAAEARLQMQRAEDAAAMARQAEADAHKALMECQSK